MNKTECPKCGKAKREQYSVCFECNKTNEQRGTEFQIYVQKHVFIERYYNTLEKTHSYKENVKSSGNPDFKFSNWLTKKEFWIEAKFRKGLYNEKTITWETETRQRQLKQHRECDKTCPVLLILGYGGTPSEPASLYLIPLSEIKSNYITSVEEIKCYEIEVNKPLSSEIIDKHLIAWNPSVKDIEQKPLEKHQQKKPYKNRLIIVPIVLLAIIGFYFIYDYSVKQTQNLTLSLEKAKRDSVFEAKKVKEKIRQDSIEFAYKEKVKERQDSIDAVDARIKKLKQDSIDDVKEEIRNNIAKYVYAETNKYNFIPCSFCFRDGDIENLKITVRNTCGYTLDNVIVEIKYLNSSNIVTATINKNFNNIAADTSMTVNAPSHAGKSVELSIAPNGIKSIALGL